MIKCKDNLRQMVATFNPKDSFISSRQRLEHFVIVGNNTVSFKKPGSALVETLQYQNAATLHMC